MTTIGEKIIAAIEAEDLVLADEVDYRGRVHIWKPNAADQLTALVQQHIDEQVRMRLESKDLEIEAAVRWLVDEGYNEAIVLKYLSKQSDSPPSNLPTD